VLNDEAEDGRLFMALHGKIFKKHVGKSHPEASAEESLAHNQLIYLDSSPRPE
jgi:hypothetical protein